MKNRTHLLKSGGFVLVVALALVFLASANMGTAHAATAPSLGTAANFGVLAGSAVTNTGPSNVTGHLGVRPGTAITGFPPGIVNPPSTIHSADAVALQAKTDTTAAYNNLAGQACDVNMTGQDLGGKTLTAGVYCFPSTSAQLTGNVTLNAQGDPNAVFVFQIGSTLTTASNSSVTVINSASACRVYWQVGSSATLGTGTAFKGNILANASITLTTGANITPGRALARTGAVTMDTNTVSQASCVLVAPTPTAVPATATTVPATPIPATATAIAPTGTPIAATPVAPTATPTKPPIIQNPSDTVPPVAYLTGTGTSGGSKFITICVKDLASGIKTIVVTKTTNAVTVVSTFVQGTNQCVIVTSTKIKPNKPSVVEVKMTDMAGNVSFGDPVLTLLKLDGVKEFKQTFKRIPAAEYFITVTNGAAGLKKLDIIVNGQKYTMTDLKNNEVRALTVAEAMTKKSNQITLIGYGRNGASAFIIISDSPMEQSDAVSESNRSVWDFGTDSFTWGQTSDQ